MFHLDFEVAICFKCCQRVNLGAITAQDSEEAMAIDRYNSAVMTWIIWRVSGLY